MCDELLMMLADAGGNAK